MNKRRKLPEILSEAEERALWAAARNPQERLSLLLPHGMGLRAHEAIGLTLDRVDLNSRVIRGNGKGQRPYELPVNNWAWDELERALRERPPEAANNPYVLCDLRRPWKGIGQRALLKRIKKLARRAGIPRPVWTHLLRHCFASNLYRETGDLGRVQKALRHSKIETTTIYAHLTTEDLRKDFEKLDRRPWLVRLWSKLKPRIVPDVLKPKAEAFYIGETIGREREISALRKAFSAGRNTVLVGEEGVGKKHLLNGLYEEQKKRGERILRLEEFKPARTAAVAVCEQLMDAGLLEEMPKGRSAKPFIEAIRQAAEKEPLTLFIDTLDDATKAEIRELRRLAQGEGVVIFSTTNRTHKAYRTILRSIFFGRYEEVKVRDFDKATTIRFAERTIADMNVVDRTAYLNHLYVESEGNPRAILELIEATRQTGDLYPKHLGREKVLSATPLITAVWMLIVLSRYSASALSHPDWKVWATIALVGLAPFILLDKLLKMRRK